jgi:hypothetical protein
MECKKCLEEERKRKRLFYRRIQKDKEKIFTKMRNEKFQNVLEI